MRATLGELGPVLDHERLLVDRRRRGETQAQAAERLGVPHRQYGRLERGEEGPPANVVGLPRRLQLQDHERCLLFRRRAKMTQSQVAAEMKCCVYWLNLMEHGRAPVQDLIDYWTA